MTTQMSYAGAAPQLALSGNIGAADTSFVAATGGTATGYPDGSAGDFVVLIGAGEKVLCSARSGTTFTVALGGRGYDETSAAAWTAGTAVNHVWDATSAQAATDHVNDRFHVHAFTDVLNGFADITGTTHQSNIVANRTQLYGRGVAINNDSATHQGGVTVGLSVSINRADPAVSINNAGGDLLRGYNGSSQVLGIDHTGKYQFLAAANNATSATAGTNGAVPAQVRGYLIVNILGTDVKIPYFSI